MATKAIENNDAVLAQRIIKSDYEVDEMEVDIEEECLKVLALHQPVAFDLRYVIAVLKINNDLERIADLASNIAGLAKALAKEDWPDVPYDLDSMTEKVAWMPWSAWAVPKGLLWERPP